MSKMKNFLHNLLDFDNLHGLDVTVQTDSESGRSMMRYFDKPEFFDTVPDFTLETDTEEENIRRVLGPPATKSPWKES